MRTLAAVLFVAAGPAIFAQSPLAIPGCEARPEVRQVIDDKLSDKVLENMKFTEQMAVRRQVLEDLIAKYPRELEPYRLLVRFTRWNDPEGYAALSERYVTEAGQHPDDPLALYLAALVLTGKDTPRSVQLWEQAKSKAPDFAWPDLSLTSVHATGKLADKKKAATEIAAFFTACPSSTDSAAQCPGTAGARRRRLARTAGPRDQPKTSEGLRHVMGSGVPLSSDAGTRRTTEAGSRRP
ncbi:MAG: hypothetical protein ABSG56_21420 [Bryobacteraceae bacterium]